MARLGKDIHQNNPGEEMNYHGVINMTANPYEGANYGYPDCFAIWDPSTVDGLPGGSRTAPGMQITLEEGDGDYNDTYCLKQTTPPRLTFPAHTAPLDVKFTGNGSSAYISFHGSW
jgi:glucose/arabinose dehydrogenase